MTQRSSILCPDCNKLISNYIDECPHCGLKSPGQKSKIYKLFGANQRSFVKIIITVNVIFFVASFLVPMFLPFRVDPITRSFGFLPAPSQIGVGVLGAASTKNMILGNWWTLITAMFLHGGIIHIAFNMLWVRDLGPMAEKFFSPHKMILIYLLSGIGGNYLAVNLPYIAQSLPGILVRMLQIPTENSAVIGASGAVFGLMGAIIAFGRKSGGFWGKQIAKQLGTWALLMIILGFIIPRVSNAGHIGGFVTGYAVGWLLPVNRPKSNNWIYIILGNTGVLLCMYAFYRSVDRIVNIESMM